MNFISVPTINYPYDLSSSTFFLSTLIQVIESST